MRNSAISYSSLASSNYYFIVSSKLLVKDTLGLGSSKLNNLLFIRINKKKCRALPGAISYLHTGLIKCEKYREKDRRKRVDKTASRVGARMKEWMGANFPW